MKTTTNFGFNKPEMTDAADITATNPNWDKIDERMNAVLLTNADNLDDIRKSGYYYWGVSGTPGGSFLEADFSDSVNSMRVWSDGEGCCQELTRMDDEGLSGCIVRRYLIDDFISKWEWVNPPMVKNEKYRTVERYKGYPVYVQLKEDGIIHKYWKDREGEQDEHEVEITPITYGTADLTPGTSVLPTGQLYFVYE